MPMFSQCVLPHFHVCSFRSSSRPSPARRTPENTIRNISVVSLIPFARIFSRPVSTVSIYLGNNFFAPQRADTFSPFSLSTLPFVCRFLSTIRSIISSNFLARLFCQFSVRFNLFFVNSPPPPLVCFSPSLRSVPLLCRPAHFIRRFACFFFLQFSSL